MTRMLVAGNWKMHGTRASARELVATIVAAPVAGVELAVMPPYLLLPALVAEFGAGTLAFGGQDVSAHAQGAYTGEV